jgi:hypothetical protein
MHVKYLILRKHFQVESYSQLVLASGKLIGSLRVKSNLNQKSAQNGTLFLLFPGDYEKSNLHGNVFSNNCGAGGDCPIEPRLNAERG